MLGVIGNPLFINLNILYEEILNMTNNQYQENELPSEIFWTLFHKSKNEEIIKSFLEEILNQNIVHLSLNNSSANNLSGFLELEKNLCLNMKMHVVKKDTLVQKLLSFWSKTLSTNTKNVSIIFTDFPLADLEKLKYFTEWETVKSNGFQKILIDCMEIYIIQENISY